MYQQAPLRNHSIVCESGIRRVCSQPEVSAPAGHEGYQQHCVGQRAARGSWCTEINYIEAACSRPLDNNSGFVQTQYILGGVGALLSYILHIPCWYTYILGLRKRGTISYTWCNYLCCAMISRAVSLRVHLQRKPFFSDISVKKMELSFCESASETNLVLFTEVLNPIFSSSCWLLVLKRIKVHMQHYLSINNSTSCCLCWCRVMIFNAALGCLVFALSRSRLRAHARAGFNLWIFM